MVKLKYRKYTLVSNSGEHNVMWLGFEVFFADIPWKNQISSMLRYIEYLTDVSRLICLFS